MVQDQPASSEVVPPPQHRGFRVDRRLTVANLVSAQPRRITAVRVWYGDSRGNTHVSDLVQSQLPDLPTAHAAWSALPGTGVQAVMVYFDEQYQQWVQDGWDESGQPINLRQETRNVCTLYQGSDYYWFSPDGLFGAGQEADLPVGIAGIPGALKEGGFMPNNAFDALYQQAKEQHTAPEG